MKKFLVVLLAMAMIFAFATTAFADDTQEDILIATAPAGDNAIPDYSDVTAETEFAGDIYRLTALGVLEGNNGWGGAYRPTEYLTRAEFAKIAVFMFGAEDTVNYYASLKSSFTDVAEGFWAEGYINAALDMGLMKGRGNGVFDPQATVTTQEVSTVVLRAVGYTDELPGAWPTDYVTKAQNVKAQWCDETLFDYAKSIGPNAATRAQMAAIVNYALDLYQVTYVAGNYTLIYGTSDVDADGYSYETLKTNEGELFEYFLGADVDAKGEITLNGDGVDYDFDITVDPKTTSKTTLLWNVFNAIEVPTIFEGWNEDKLVEAAGWGYEDFEDGEIAFNSAIEDIAVPAAANYYIFDETMDGELWNLGGRVAMLTINLDPAKTSLKKIQAGKLDGVEVPFVEMLTDVEYVTDGTKVNGEKIYNGNVYSLELDGVWGFLSDDVDDFVYDFDNYVDMPFAVVSKVKDDMVVLNDGTELCLLDECKKHDMDYVVLKDGEMKTDASALAVNDIVYYAGTAYGEDDVEVFVAFAPAEVTMEKLDATAKDGIGVITLSGEEYNYKVNTVGALMSDDNGDSFVKLDYKELRNILKDEDNDASVLFAEAYAKTFVGALIFDQYADTTTYGVVVDITEDHAHIGGTTEWIYDTITIMGADGKEVTYTFDEDLVCTTLAQRTALEAQFKLGDLITFVAEDDEIVVDSIAQKVDGRYDGFKVAFAPAATEDFKVNAKGVLNNGLKAKNTFVNGVAATNSFASYSISADTVVFIVSTDDDEFDAVEIGKASDFIGKTTKVAQYGVLHPEDSDIDVLYLVDADTDYTTVSGYGLMTEHYTVKSQEYVVIDGEKYAVDEDADFADVLEDDAVYFVGYTTVKGELTNLVPAGAYNYDEVKKGDLVVLVDELGFGINAADAKVLLADIVEDYENVAYITDREDLEDYTFADDLKAYDMTGEYPNAEDNTFELEDIDHDGDDFDYIIVFDDFDEIAMIFAVNYAD